MHGPLSAGIARVVFVLRVVSLKLPFVGRACQKAVPLPIAPSTASPMSNQIHFQVNPDAPWRYGQTESEAE